MTPEKVFYWCDFHRLQKLKEKDEETLNEARKLGLFGDPKTEVDGIPAEEYRGFLEIFEPAVIPKADITTKPRACNYGLLRAKGKYCVIYDADDNPDKDQLKKAAIAFSRSRQEIACLQSKLNFYNAKEKLQFNTIRFGNAATLGAN